ncbi:MAG: hypothetical protein ACKO96_27220, partial [Flammeovirgaceae bacterium]
GHKDTKDHFSPPHAFVAKKQGYGNSICRTPRIPNLLCSWFSQSRKVFASEKILDGEAKTTLKTAANWNAPN